jgi:hypothetical protein
MSYDRANQRRTVVFGTELELTVEGGKRPLGNADIGTCGARTSVCPSAS